MRQRAQSMISAMTRGGYAEQPAFRVDNSRYGNDRHLEREPSTSRRAARRGQGPGDPDRDAGVACGDGDPVGPGERLVADELGADGSESLSEAPARFVGRHDEEGARPAGRVDQHGDEAAVGGPDTAGDHVTSGSAAWTCSAATACFLASAAAVSAWCASRFTLRGSPLVAWWIASSAAGSKSGSSVPASRSRWTR